MSVRTFHLNGSIATMSDSAEERRWTLRRAVATSVGLLVVGVAAFVATLLIESPVRGLLLCIGITSGGLGILGLASVKRSQDSPEKWGTMGRTGKYLVRGYVFLVIVSAVAGLIYLVAADPRT